ncbi:MAG: NAD-dependent epimerase/dehydratase family protein [Candidatus Pacebacteria bacterium]|nr:NAD-dependent epimerase/dehydratase family protein [Candidatus Paceibacterota bacterium]
MNRVNLDGRRVFVTGASGFIGGNLVRYLLKLGAEVSVLLEHEVPSTTMFPREVHISVGSVTDGDRITAIVTERDPEHIFHCAGLLRVINTERQNSMLDYISINMLGSIYIAEASRTLPNLHSFVSLGSLEECGGHELPLIETDREVPISQYSFSKLCATKYIEFLRNEYHFPGVVLRPTIVYGPGQSGGMFIPSLIDACVTNREFRMTKGEQRKDFVYIDDMVRAMVLATSVQDVSHTILHIGSGVETQLKEVASTVERLAGGCWKATLGAIPYRSEEKMHYCADISRARNCLGWEPSVALEEGLKNTIEWRRKISLTY